MKAIRFHEYGGPDVLREEDIAEPEAGPGHEQRKHRQGCPHARRKKPDAKHCREPVKLDRLDPID